MFRTKSRLSRLTIVAAITIPALFWLATNAPPKVQQATIAATPQLPADPLVVNLVVTVDARGTGRRTAQMPLTLDLIGFR